MKIKVWLLTILLTLGSLSISFAAPTPPVMSLSTNGVRVDITWTEVAGATGYTLLYAPSPYAGPQTIVSKDMGTKTSFSANLWDGAAYYVAIEAYNPQDVSGYSNIELFTIQVSNASKSIVGTWELSKISMNGESSECPGRIEHATNKFFSCGTEQTTYYEDGTFILFQTTDEKGNPDPLVYKGNWEVTGDTLTLTLTAEGTDLNNMSDISPYSPSGTLDFYSDDEYTFTRLGYYGTQISTFTKVSGPTTDPPDSELIIGTWKTAAVSKNGQSSVCPGRVEYAPDSFWNCYDEYWTYNSDGSFVSSASAYNQTNVKKGTWNLDGEALRITVLQVGPDGNNLVSVSPSSLSFTINFVDNNEFKRIFTDSDGDLIESMVRQ